MRRPFDDSVRSSEGLWGSCGCGNAKSPSARQWRPTVGLAAASPTAAAVPRSTHAKRNRVMLCRSLASGPTSASATIQWLERARPARTLMSGRLRPAWGGSSSSRSPSPVALDVLSWRERTELLHSRCDVSRVAFFIRASSHPAGRCAGRWLVRPSQSGPHPYRWQPNDDCEGDDRVRGLQSSYARRSRAICALEPHWQPRRRVAAAFATAPRRESPSCAHHGDRAPQRTRLHVSCWLSPNG